MRNKYFLHVVILGFILGGAGCTSKKVEPQDNNAEIAELTGEASDSAVEGDAAPTTEDSSATADEDFGDDSGLEGADSAKEEVATKDDAAAGTSDQAATDDMDGLDEMPADDTAKTDDLAANSDASAEPGLDAGTSSENLETAEAPPAEEPAPDTSASLSADETQGLTDTPVDEPKPVIPLQKMASAPYMMSGKPINAIYIARAGDTTKSVSQKIYGEDRSKELKKINPTLARRAMKVGDKVYYNSPQRPTDSTQMLTYYEDMGLAPEVYLSQPGDNIRTVAKNLLGHENSWKEIWATNPDVESKGELAEGTRLRYWSSAPAAPVMAANDTPPPAAAGTTGTPPPAEEPPPMPEEVSAAPPPAEVPPPEPVAAVPPPPPVAAVPPPPPKVNKPVSADPMAALSEDPDQMMALGAGAILLLAAIFMFIIIKKKRARRNSGIDFQTATHTQIE